MSVSEPRRGSYWAQQSPIDINDSIYTAGLRPLRFCYPTSVRGVLETPEDDPGYSFKLDLGSGACLEFAQQRCPLLKIHLHVPSEHTIDGMAFPMEIHLVHQIPRPMWGSTKVVVGVFVQKGREGDSASVIRDFVCHVKQKPADPVVLDPNKCIPPDHDFYRYEGSLTTPDYDESVSWILLRTPLSALEADLRVLTTDASHEARPTQPLQRRFVLRNFQEPSRCDTAQPAEPGAADGATKSSASQTPS